MRTDATTIIHYSIYSPENTREDSPDSTSIKDSSSDKAYSTHHQSKNRMEEAETSGDESRLQYEEFN